MFKEKSGTEFWSEVRKKRVEIGDKAFSALLTFGSRGLFFRGKNKN